MKTKTIFLACTLFLTCGIFAQDRTTVNAMSSEISDNLDLRAIASIFGQAKNLEDFERQLNDPQTQLSNLDLNDDNQVDYLRVIESAEKNTHLIIVQAVLGKDLFQDVATIEVEKDRNNKVRVQVVGDVYMYGDNYIYEPVYVTVPVIYNTFWVPRYRPYCSAWYWGYYPTYYYAWTPFPVFRYRHHINIHINFHNHYNYVTTRSCTRAYALHRPLRANYCERTYPTRAFAYRNNTVKNSYELNQTRQIKNVRYPNDVAYTNTTKGRNPDPIKQSTRTENHSGTRTNSANFDPIRQSPRNEGSYQNTRTNEPVKLSTRNEGSYQSTRTNEPIKLSTRTEVYGTRNQEPIKQNTRYETSQIGRQKPDRDTRTNNQTNNGERTRGISTPKFETGNSTSHTSRVYNSGNIGRENSPRGERTSNNERRSR
ncbi:hypothetical protein [Flavobacterium lotistagni]|uniref:hypothetical protein n=1 Tax=Flavobacterium lotistagni TaxID=2709660 RepID=UPI001A9C7003|nr:hypothetical protein [Flavobacterium lotistagni]